MVCTFLRFFVVGGAICSAAPQNKGFLRNGAGTARMVDASELEVSLRESLEGAMGSGTWARRAADVERKMSKTFQALPKNDYGRLAPPTVRYIVHNYFQKEHGWLIEGLEPTGVRANASEIHSAHIIQNKAPAILEAILEDRQDQRGLALADAVAMMAALEHLIFDESVVLLERAYALNDYHTGDVLDETGLHEVLRSYLLLFRQGQSANLYDGNLHRSIKARYSTKAGWHEIVSYEQDVQHDYDFNNRMKTNPFITRQYSFEEASQMVINLAEGYGKWQNADCRDMKEHLMGLDVRGTGRIPLDVFYRSEAGSAFEFTESQEYLRDVGALDESLKGNPSVLVANYLAGPSNCIASNAYYSVCCLSECEHLMNEIEGHVRGPTATSQQLLGLLSNVSSTTVDAPRTFSSDMTKRLSQIANQNEGTIPVHGRLFGQWLHYAFPYECPLPITAQNALTPSAWLNGAAIGTMEEREQHIQTVEELDLVGEHSTAEWTEEEILPFVDQPNRKKSGFFGFMRFIMMVSAILFVFKAGYESLQTAMCAHQGTEYKDKKCALPI
jgi:hypothetical protein